MLIASDPSTGRLMVLTPLSNSPAARAGVQSGDEATPLPLHPVQYCNSTFGKSIMRTIQYICLYCPTRSGGTEWVAAECAFVKSRL